MLIAGILFVVFSIVIVIGVQYDELTERIKKNDDVWAGALCGGMFLTGVLFIAFFATRNIPLERKLSDNTLTVEIRQTIIEDDVIKSDTVYIFTPKKKK
jgi:apolipoprotein N-acyltransferase